MLNPGAVGQSRSRDARARLAVLDTTAREATFHAVPYDVEGCRRALQDRGLPPQSCHVPRSRWDDVGAALRGASAPPRADAGAAAHDRCRSASDGSPSAGSARCAARIAQRRPDARRPPRVAPEERRHAFGVEPIGHLLEAQVVVLHRREPAQQLEAAARRHSARSVAGAELGHPVAVAVQHAAAIPTAEPDQRHGDAGALRRGGVQPEVERDERRVRLAEPRASVARGRRSTRQGTWRG